MFEPVGGLLTGALKRGHISDKTTAAQILHTVGEWLVEQWGQEVSDIVHPAYVKNKTVVIATINASFATEIRYRQRLLLERIDERHGRGVIEAIQVEL
jgi:hypothetical protein